MINLKNILVIILLIGMFCSLQAQDNYVLKRIKFEGNSTISASSLKKNLSLHARNLGDILIFWNESPQFNELYLEDDINQIIVQYQKGGFLDVEVSSRLETNQDKEEVILIFQIKENTPVLIKEILYEINTARIEDKAVIQEQLDKASEGFYAKTGRRFIDSNIKNTISQINKILLENGFPDPLTEFDVQLTEQNTRAKVIYTINAGDYCDFGEIRVKGNAKLADKVILKQVSFAENEMFSQSQTQKTQQQIQNLGMFQYVTIKTMLNEVADNKIPVEILVKELPYWSVKTGIGYGLEDRFRVTMNLLKLGFLGGARRANLLARHSYLEPYNFSLQITQPDFINPQGSISLKPFIKKEHEPAYDLRRFGLSTTLQQNLHIYTSTFITYKFERDYLQSDVMEVTLETEKGYYNKSNISLGISTDNSEPVFTPDKGLMASFVTTLAGLKLGSKYHYWQGLADLRKYQKIMRGTVLAGRFKIGSMQPIWGDITTPIEERFFAGGSNSIRGWKRGEIGPLTEDGLALGGESYLEFSTELRQHLWRMFYGVAFLDAGNVWEHYDEYDLNDLVYSAGLGLRIKTPLGPIRFDAAQPLWSSRKQILLHLSIGQAF
ncbi:MAG: BamA/TamA family outer membrane protein [Candidatus Cloacimonetes bacterium]|nr:BamA/TamA family outer membrane protein [Candidatus Cloacimonadota bacterium]